jgi:hypothetical protein
MLTALAVAFAGSAFAQEPPGQLKKAPNQVVPTGEGEQVDPRTGRPREATPEETAALEAALRQFTKRAEGATFTFFDNGMVRAELDDSFMEAMTVTLMPDGSLKYGHAAIGTQKAAKNAAKNTAKSVKKTGTTGDKTAKTIEKAPKVTPPVFEEKE